MELLDGAEITLDLLVFVRFLTVMVLKWLELETMKVETLQRNCGSKFWLLKETFDQNLTAVKEVNMED